MLELGGRIMMRKFLISLIIIVILFVLVGCVQKYPIVTLEEIKAIKAKKGDLPQIQYILLGESADVNTEQTNLGKVMLFLKEKEFEEAGELVNSLRNNGMSDEKLNFYNGLIAFFEEEYSVALHLMELAEVDNYKHLQYVIIGDCMYEMTINSDYKNFTTRQILDNYQKALDYCETDVCKEIINVHIKYAKYGGMY